MSPERSPKVGLLALMLELYDQSNPELRPDREGFAERLGALLGECADVTYGGIANTRSGVEAACRQFAAEDVDAVVVTCLSYAPSLIALPALRGLSVPIILLNTQELAGVGEGFGYDELLRNHGMHGLHDLANVLNRSGVPFHVVTGHVADPAVRRELADWCCAAYAVRELQSLRIGLFGHPFTGMGDFGVDETTFLADIGPEVDRVDPSELPRRAAAAPVEAVQALMEGDRQAFAIAEDVMPEVHEASSRVEWALRDLVRERGLGAIALHYPPLAAASPGGVLPFLGAAKLMQEGIGFGGEGDVTSAALVHLAGLLYGEASFTEMFTIDFEGGAVFHAHFAEANPALAREDQPIRLVLRDGWVGCGGPSASLAFSNQPGPATLLNLTVGAQGRFRLIAAGTEVLDYAHPTFVMPHFRARPGLPLNAFLTGYLEAGGSHHLAIVEGHGLPRIEKAAALMDVELVTL
jgi:L-arabinose isomerase